MSTLSRIFIASLLLAPVGCSSRQDMAEGEDRFSSNQATMLVFQFDGEFVTDSSWGTGEQLIEDQLLFTIGHLNGNDAVGRLDAVKLTDVKRESLGARYRITYHAELPVAWGSKTDFPSSYEFKLPRDLGYSARASFTEKYKHSCVDHAAHDVDTGSMWYYYRPNISGCSIAEEELFRTTASVSVSSLNTSGKYPEYDKVWEDGELNVVAVFGKYEKGTTSDVGISGYSRFVRELRSRFHSYAQESTPAVLPEYLGVETPDVEVRIDLGNGRKIRVNALLVDEVSTASQEFFSRYEALSTDADLIAYNGHAGLGQNVRALSSHGDFKAGKYVIVFMNGCDTFAYVDGSLAEKRALLNPDDPTGTKYMEFVTNTMPAFFSEMPQASLALLEGLAAYDAPKTYDEMFEDVDDDQIIVVTGEEDNVYQP